VGYKALYRTYRPQKFDEVAGQKHIIQTLKNAIRDEKIAHAYLFSGPRGCGKTSSARILAKALNCHNGPSATPCEECTACKEITKGSSLDVIEIDGASNTSVNDIRQIKDEVLFPPNSSKYKIYIIDEVHMLSTSAFNALLKTIEEPPEYVIFIFATTELHKVPATIKSRCQQFHFRLGTVDQIKEVLAKASSELGIQADDEALFWIAREATGSFRDAYTLFDQVVAFSDNHITYEKIRDKLGLVGVERLNEIAEFCVDGNPKSALEKLDEITANGVSIEQFVSNFADYLRSLLLIQSGITKESLLGQNIQRFSQKVLSSWNKMMLERALSLMLQLFRDIRYSVSPRYELELAISRLCWLTSYVSVTEVKTAIEQAKALLMQGQVVQQNVSQQNIQQNSAFAPKSEGFSHPFLNSGYQEERKPSITANATPKETFAPQIQIPAPVEKPVQTYQQVNEQPQTPQFEVEVQKEKDVKAKPELTIEELKKETIHELEVINPFLTSILIQTSDWSFNNNTIQIEVETPYLKRQIETYKKEIIDFIAKLWQKNVGINPVIKAKVENTQPQEELPEVVDLLCTDFRGKVVQVYNVQKSPSMNNSQMQKTEHSEDKQDEIYEEENDEF
jgi:DNA polymerase-3 subunit gamma/tau